MYVDSMNTVIFWSWLTMLCALALFIQGAFLLRAAIHARRLWWSLLAGVPLIVSLWSWNQVWIAFTMTQFPYIIWGHINAAFYARLLWPLLHATRVAQIQVLLLLIVFVLTAIMEARFLPRVRFSPVWTMRRMDSFNLRN